MLFLIEDKKEEMKSRSPTRRRANVIYYVLFGGDKHSM